ncbi:MAG: HDOD domain-containing protein [Proteobacteria bacterium]|nr:HDOD domain-containing protein [Pseudomonadota bacterium]MBU4295452.1 HDOD domain-containing protein [Pseudomonadota bacterium]MCG2747639.1 HDOD domain-containing protein [Desulfobulbaceae bacterium]
MKPKQESNTAFDQQVNFLKKISFFQDFDDHELKQLLAVSRWLKVPPGTLIIKEDTLEKVFYILVKGSVSVFITVDQSQTIELTTLATGDTFGEMALVSETRRTAGVKTTSESYILMVEPDILNQASVFLQLKFYRRFCEILVTRLIAANKRMGDLSSQAAESSASKQTQPRPVVPPRPQQPPQKKETAPPPDPLPAQTPGAPPRKIEVNVSELPPAPKLMAVAKAKIKRRIQSNLELAVNPSVSARLASFLVGDCEDIRKFSELISCDPMLSAKVIQQANSSFYRRTTTVNSVPHAMVTMGIKNLQEVIAQETMKVFNEEELFGGFGQLADNFWLHSVAVGRIAELLRDTIRINISEDVYLAGLFHDLGKLALDRQQPLFYPQLLRPDFIEKDICTSEQEYIGIDHAQAGYWLGEKMGLPKPYLDVMLMHHTPEKARENVLLTGLIHLADLFAKDKGMIMGKEGPPQSLSTAFGWIIVQEQHRPFIDVNVDNFIRSFKVELERTWGEMSSLPLT